MIYYFVIFIFILMGLRMLLKVIYQEPITTLSKTHHKKLKLYKIITPFIRLNKKTYEALEKKLLKTNTELTPEEFIAQGIVKVIPFGTLAVILTINKNYFIGTYLLLGAAFFFYSHLNILKRKEKEIRNEQIEELPEFMSYLTNSLKVEKDISKILEDYRGSAGALENELEQLRADLKTGNVDMALFDFDLRVNISHLSNYIGVVRATLNGEIQYAALDSITKDMEDYENENAKKYAKQIPGKIRRASFAVSVSVILFFLTIMIYAGKIGLNKF